MHSIQPPKYPATNSDTAATTVVEKKPSGVQVNYSLKEMEEAVESGKRNRDARKISERKMSPDKGASVEEKQRADKVAGVFWRAKVGKLNPLKPRKESSHPARRADTATLRALRKIKGDQYLAHKLAKGEQTTIWVGDDIASHQGVLDHRSAPAGEFDRAFGAIVQQPSGNSSPIRQPFFAEDFYHLSSELDKNQVKQLFHNLSDNQQEQFRDYCLKHVDLDENEVLMGLLFP